MADESTITRSGWDTCIASAAVNDQAYSTSGNSSSLNDMGTSNITAAQKDWDLLDFYLNISSGTITDGDYFELLRVSNSSANTSEDFGTGRHPVGIFRMTGSGDADVYLYGVSNVDQYDEWQVFANTTNNLTLSLKCRTRTSEPAA